MNLNQYQISMLPAFEPKVVHIAPCDLPSFLGELLGGTPPVVLDDPFANGWNAAMQHMRDNPPAPAPLSLPTNVIFNNPATIVYWDDGTKTVVKCQPGDVFSAEAGLTTAMLKKYMGNDNTFNRVINEWLKRTGEYKLSVVPALSAAEMPATLPTPAVPETVE